MNTGSIIETDKRSFIEINNAPVIEIDNWSVIEVDYWSFVIIIYVFFWNCPEIVNRKKTFFLRLKYTWIKKNALKLLNSKYIIYNNQLVKSKAGQNNVVPQVPSSSVFFMLCHYNNSSLHFLSASYLPPPMFLDKCRIKWQHFPSHPNIFV